MITAGFIVIVLGALGALLFGVNALQKSRRLGAESGRKLVHLGMGLISLALPWFFQTAGPVWLLGMLGGLAVGVVRFVPAATRRLGAVLGGVGRSSLGDLYFPLGVALAFTLARGTPMQFCGAVGVLTFADSAGALVGTRWGRHPYSVFGNRKSLEGSAAVLLTAAAWIAWLLAILGHEHWSTALSGGLLVGTAAAVIEAVSWRGLDNLLLPVGIVELMVIWSDRGSSMMQSLAIAISVAVPVVIAGLVHVAVIKLRLLSRLAAIPLDGGMTLGGRTLFGENKTLRGALVMIVAAAGCVWLHVQLSLLWPWAGQLLPSFERSHPLVWGVLAGAGYIAGELPNSFAKRRLGIGPGATATGSLGAVLWTVDQIDSMIGVLVFLLPVWSPSFSVIVALLGVTLVVHPAVALVMFILGVKTRVG